MTRFGMGYDVHRLVAGRKLIIGGVEIPHSLGLLGHSDADVLLHAVADALLGAAALGDIGKHFPDTDPRAAREAVTDLAKRHAGYAGIFTAKYACNAHGAVHVCNDNVRSVEFTLNPVEGPDGLSFLCAANDHLASANLGSVKDMKRLAKLEQYEVRNIDNIVDRVKTYGAEVFLQPFG